ncbi:unnamed protein product [Phytophthora fragariaefolia]|uniref:Unnamed protein product n=1 Tax=Phytophthora fragariaefolia TaxID=1490495 RepID=A0A9W7DBI6_9STRA|nr:unnamed protein product [Phytophthora fragariaefolia]GMF82032.1 unnamed protein product [Phytophthora fragariaefolia]
MGRKDKKQQQVKEEEKPSAEKNAGNAKGGKKEQPAKEGTSSYPVDQTVTTFDSSQLIANVLLSLALL